MPDAPIQKAPEKPNFCNHKYSNPFASKENEQVDIHSLNGGPEDEIRFRPSNG